MSLKLNLGLKLGNVGDPAPLSQGRTATHIFDPSLLTLNTGDLISSIKDKNTAITLTASGSARPTLSRLYGFPTILMSGAQKLASAAAALALASNNFSITIVWDFNDTFAAGDASYDNALYSFMGSGGDRYMRQFTGTTNLYDGTLKSATGGAPMNAGAFNILTLWGNGSNTFTIGNGVYNSFSNAATLAGGNITEIILGMLTAGTKGFIGHIAYLEIGTAFANSTDALASHAALRARVGWPPHSLNKNYYIFQGDSITAGSHKTMRSLRYCDLAMANSNLPYKTGFVVRGYSSMQTDQANSLRTTWAQPNITGTGKNQLLIFNLAVNTIALQSTSNGGELAYFYMTGGSQYFANLKAAYPDLKIAVMTCIASNFATSTSLRETQRLDFNSRVKASTSAIPGVANCYTKSGSNFEYVIDVAALTQFDATADTANATYFQADGTHLQNAGDALLAGVITPFLNYYETL